MGVRESIQKTVPGPAFRRGATPAPQKLQAGGGHPGESSDAAGRRDEAGGGPGSNQRGEVRNQASRFELESVAENIREVTEGAPGSSPRGEVNVERGIRYGHERLGRACLATQGPFDPFLLSCQSDQDLLRSPEGPFEPKMAEREQEAPF